MTKSKVQDGGEMPRGGWPDEAVADIAARRDALRQSASLPGAEPRALIDAALTELDAAIEALGAASPVTAADADGPAGEVLPEAVRTERRLLHAVFQQAPVPLFLLEQDGTIRRANNQAAALLGSPSGYATGKPLTAFVDLPFRAAVQTLLAAVARTGKPRTVGCRILTSEGPVDVTLTAAAADLPGDPPVRIVTVAPGGPSGAMAAEREDKPAKRPAAKAKGDPAIAAMTRRLDAVTAVTRVLLDNSTFSEAVTLQRSARLLAGEIA
ncbi:MAG TPA: PAS domain-containing protein, partial [Trebonia sp.]